MNHWPTASVAVVVAVVTAVSGIVRKLLHVALIAIIVTGTLLVVDTVTGGNIQRDLNLTSLLSLGSEPRSEKG